MNYPDNFNGTSMDLAATDESDRADEGLQLVVDYKRDLLAFLDTRRGELKAGASAMREYMEEIFDEAFCSQWHELAGISGSAGWPTSIPPFETLSFETPKQRSDREWRQSRFRPQPTRGASPQNPATLAARDEAV